MAFDLLAIGDVSIDQFMRLKEAEVSGTPEEENYKICFNFASKVPVEEFHSNIAGNSCNNVISAAKLGVKAGIYTEFGDDGNADQFLKEFKRLDINSDYCIRNKGCNTNVHTIIAYEDERTIFSYHAPQQYKIRDWPKPKWIYYTSLAKGFEEFQQELVSYLKENPDIGVAFNPGTYHLDAGLDSLRNILEVTDVLFVNRVEAEQFVGENDIYTVHEKLQQLGPKLTVITEGARGSSAYDGNDVIKLGIFTDLRPVIDKTGAGDAHSAGFLSALYHGKNLKTALQWGTINSASVIRQVGATHGQITKKEIEEVLKQNPSFEEDKIN